MKFLLIMPQQTQVLCRIMSKNVEGKIVHGKIN